MTAKHSDLSSLADRASVGDSAARSELSAVLELDRLNLDYFLSLWRAKNARPRAVPRLFDPRQDQVGDDVFSYSTAVLPESWRVHAPFWNYNDLEPAWAETVRKTTLWIRKMHAGTGTSLERTRYLAQMRGEAEDRVVLGAKGTDLFVEVDGANLSLAELQLRQARAGVESERYGAVIFQELVSQETSASIARQWQRPVDQSGETFTEYATRSGRFSHRPSILQSSLPTLDEKGKLSLRRLAPGGHGFFGVHALLELLRSEVPVAEPTVLAISNGEDLNAWPDPLLVGWMIERQIPIAMIATEKTPLDLKGGQVVLVGGKEPANLALIEAAQAKSLGQQRLFEALGVDVGDRTAAFNTNLVLINCAVLLPKLQAWVQRDGAAAVEARFSADLIRNPKRQSDSDGVEREYVQLEGAMGSVFLNLDAAWREQFEEPLVHVLEIPRDRRTAFFCPVKTALDYVILFGSDRFELDTEYWRLVDRRPGALFSVDWPEAPTTELSELRALTQGWSIRELDHLQASGAWDLSLCSFRGNVELHNETGARVRLADLGLGTSFANLRVDVGPGGTSTSPLSAQKRFRS